MKDIRSYIGWGIYLLIGVILAALVIVTGTYGTEAEKGKIVRCVDSAEL